MSSHAPKKIDQSDYERELSADIAEFYDDPYGYVMYAFPWGEEGPLEAHEGPDAWQRDQLMRVACNIDNDPEATIREAIASGHGIGKSAEVAWIIMWCMSTRPHLNGVVTANTTNQLTTKTWRELALWHKRAINEHWFKWTATKFFHIEHPETWFVAATPNTEHNSEAFAGLHGTHVLIIYDEASGIPNKIWEVSEGAMTEKRAMWFVFGNPTKNTGKFRDLFSDDKRWTTHCIDSRTCKMTNKKELASQIEVYGEDSDFVRVRIKGQFPRVGSTQFIASEMVKRCMFWEAPFEAYYAAPILIGVDVARFGDDRSIVLVRQGRKVLEIRTYRELNTMQLTAKVIEAIREFRPVVTFVDGLGMGAGVVDRLHELNYAVVDVVASNKPQDEEVYYNKRVEMWDRMKHWLAAGADLPMHDKELHDDLIGVEYGYDDKEKMRLERKKDMKARGLASPDTAEALALTFAEHVSSTKNDSFEPDDSFEPGEVA